ncbi:hypothetical protein WBG78_13585 [Chryseolinea sp. T2]|uniref:hypothetical protein n=1 Tax=Chryseolinea sp. T2 TaxID=3129255 RepID=UPI0030788C67
METVQPSSYTRSSVISCVILLILLWGFHRTYTVFFPSFEGFLFVQHFHGFMMLLWMGMLIVQPLFIASRKHHLHQLVGRASFVIAPLIMLSIYLVSEMVFHRNVQEHTLPDAYAEIALSVPSIPIFAILYGLAISNRHRTFYHMRYMIGTGIMMIGPGLGRIMGIWFGVPGPLIVTSTLIIVALVAFGFLIVDIARKKDFRPYAIVTLLMVVQSVLWEMRYSGLLQSVEKGFASIAY